MKQNLLVGLGLLLSAELSLPARPENQAQIAVKDVLNTIKTQHAYQDHPDWTCLEQQYGASAASAQDRRSLLLLLEVLLMEFADSHMSLNTNTSESWRLNGAVRLKPKGSEWVVEGVNPDLADWEKPLSTGAVIKSVNGQGIDAVIQAFPTKCLDKKPLKTQQWILNKRLAGRRGEPLVMQFSQGGKTDFVTINYVQNPGSDLLLTTRKHGDVGVIRVMNSLGNNGLIKAFDAALDQFSDTAALVIDLRDTADGGNTYVARALMGRFVSEPQPYQKHRFIERSGDGPAVPRLWAEYVEPRGQHFNGKVVVLVSGWTGSMGEGMAVGFNAIVNAPVIGTPMAGLRGAIESFPIAGESYSLRLPVEQLFHIDGTPREHFQPIDTKAFLNDEMYQEFHAAIETLLR